MIWQDVAFTLGSLVLCITLIPMLRTDHHPPLISSVPIALVLAVFTLTYVTLGFVLAPLIEGTQTLLWAWLALQRVRTGQ